MALIDSFKRFFQNECLRKGHSILVVICVLAFVIFSFRPLTILLLTNSQNVIVSDGGDSSGATKFIREYQRQIKENPLRLFYPQVNAKQLDAPEGSVVVLSYMERIAYSVSALFFAPEQALGFYLHLLLFLNLVVFYFFGISLEWGSFLSLVMATVYCVSPFVRARAETHPSLAGVFVFPLAFIVADRCKRFRAGPNSILITSLLFLLLASSTPYLLLILLIVSPFVLVYCLDGTKVFSKNRKSLLLAALPSAILILALWKGTTSVDSLVSVAPIDLSNQFWKLYGAHGSDYIRQSFLGKIIGVCYPNLIPGLAGEIPNPTEHAHGLSVILLALSPFGYLAMDRKAFFFWVALVVFAFWCSLGADFHSPASFIRLLLPEFRVANRFSPLVTLGVLVLSGNWISKNAKKNPFYYLLPCLALLELAPTQPLATAHLPEKFRMKEPCGTVIALPYLSQTQKGLKLYQLYNSFRDTDCRIVNRSGYRDFPLGFHFTKESLQCLGVDWIFAWTLNPKICKEVGASIMSEGLCKMAEYQKVAKTSLACVLEQNRRDEIH